MKKALKLALEALNDLAAWHDGEVGGHMDEPYAAEVARRTITAIKESLAQPEQEPVAFKIYKPTPPRHATPNVRDAELPWVYDQDPSSGNVASMWVTPVKATSPQRTWVGLTEDEAFACKGRDYFETYRAIEAKLKEKNNG
jgi:hypothetical protein